MATLEQKQELIEILKFTPRTYKITMWGYGGEYVMGTVERKIYDYFRHRRLSLSDFAWDNDYADQHNIPEEMWPFPPGSWYECDDMGHVHGVDRNAGTLQIDDENGETIYQRELENITGGEEDEPEWGGGEEVWVGSKPAGTVVFLGVSNEKGTFFEGEINLDKPFDITKLEIGYDEFDGNDIINSVKYNDEYIENWGANTNGKSSDFGMYLLKDSNSWTKYCTMDDLEYEMTDWFPKKIKPVREGVYMVKTAGKSSYTYQCKWTGSRWISAWSEDVPETEEVKIKEWQGLAKDPDADLHPDNIVNAFNTVFEEFSFEDAVSELEKVVEELDEKVNGKKSK
jgi:hypothetical protein